ncbi:MAG TPA: hypothetical protein ENH14_01555 [candidate division WOR-3 bacterium]|uniref:Uncharacterized protein n=1 Tax=candidate division WOR-3 bacterium TaxID=2052148 RepID=A0A7V0LUQ9_UNCW3|nr:hypothetical protein [candidate division WOR-3 bacterium]
MIKEIDRTIKYLSSDTAKKALANVYLYLKLCNTEQFFGDLLLSVRGNEVKDYIVERQTNKVLLQLTGLFQEND